jgi:hypothetical protein
MAGRGKNGGDEMLHENVCMTNPVLAGSCGLFSCIGVGAFSSIGGVCGPMLSCVVCCAGPVTTAMQNNTIENGSKDILGTICKSFWCYWCTIASNEHASYEKMTERMSRGNSANVDAPPQVNRF